MVTRPTTGTATRHYYHLVFSVPHRLVPLMWQNKKLLFELLFEASAATLLEVAANPKRLGAQIGFLERSAYVGPDPAAASTHSLRGARRRTVAGPSALDSSPHHFFLPVRVLSRVFRGKFVAGLRSAFARTSFASLELASRWPTQKAFAAFLRTLFREDWVVYAKKPFGGPEHVLHYLARYTHRVAISNHRLLNVTDHDVTFRWKDYAHHSKARTMTLTHEEFLRRFLQHVLAHRLSAHPLLRLSRQSPARPAAAVMPQSARGFSCHRLPASTRYCRPCLPSLSGTHADHRAINCVATSVGEHRLVADLDSS